MAPGMGRFAAAGAVGRWADIGEPGSFGGHRVIDPKGRPTRVQRGLVGVAPTLRLDTLTGQPEVDFRPWNGRAG